MKKISTVLLVLVLVGSVAFAGFTGNADVSFGADLDQGTWGFENAVELTSDVVISETLVDNAGDGDIKVEIAAELTFGFDFEDEGNEFDASTGLTGNAEITKATIMSDTWSVSILGSMSAPNFAVSALDAEDDSAGDDDGDAIDLDPSNYVANMAGVEVGFAGFTFGLSADAGTWEAVAAVDAADEYYAIDNDPTSPTYGTVVLVPAVAASDAVNVPYNTLDGAYYNIFGSVTTPEYTLGDGLTAVFGAAGLLSDGNNAASASATVAYASDMLNATVSTDMIFDAGFMAEVAVAATYDAYSLDVYYATDDDSATFDSDDEAGYTAYTDATDILSAKVAATVADLTLTLTGLDLVHQQDLTIAASYPVSDMLTVGASFGYVVSGASAEDWSVGVDATYTTDMYTLAAAAGFNSDEELSMSASVESTTLIPGATLSLAWADADYINSGAAIGDNWDTDTTDLGSITASINIAF